MTMASQGAWCCTVIFAAIAMFITGHPPADADCPVKIDHIFLNSLGSTNNSGEYQVNMSTGQKGPFSIWLVATAGTTPEQVIKVLAPNVDFSKNNEAQVIVISQYSNVTEMHVQEVVPSDTEVSVDCETPPVAVDGTQPAQTTWRFDDQVIPVGPTVLAKVLTLPGRPILVPAPLDYPLAAKQQGIQGTAQVAITVDPFGAILSVWVLHSSGSKLLDASGLKAAKPFTFGQPAAGGSPVAATYVLTYMWLIQARL